MRPALRGGVYNHQWKLAWFSFCTILYVSVENIHGLF